MSELYYLRSNFNEMHSAATYPGNGEIVANFWGSKVYDASKGWGRVWVWIYSFLDIFIKEDLLQNKLELSLRKINTVFQNQLTSIRSDIKKYQEYIQKSADEKELHPVRQRITDWNRTTQFFFNHLADNKLFEKLLNLPEKSEIDSIQKLQKIIKFEGLLHEPIPFELIKKVASDSKLDANDMIELKRWIKKLQTLKFRTVHHFLTTLFSLENQGFKQFAIENFELKLLSAGFKEVADADPKHFEWKNSLKPGDIITNNGKKYVLGEQVGKSEANIDRMTYFSLPDHPDKLLALGNNEAILRVRMQIAKQDQWALETAKTLEVDSSGRSSIIERLCEPLENHHWTSSEANITREDRDFADPIAALIRFIIKKEMTPRHFTPHLVMYDKEGTLRSVKVSVWFPFSFNTLEDFIFECSNGNLLIYQYLMNKSGLDRHPTADFYQSIMMLNFEGKDSLIAHRAAIRGVNHTEVIKRANELCTAFNLHKENLAKERGITEEEAATLIYKEYRATKAAGILITSARQPSHDVR